MRLLLWAGLVGVLCFMASPSWAQGGPYASMTFGPVKILPASGRPPKKVSFPDIRDWKTLRFTLERTGCFGDCPAYQIEIVGDGSVKYESQGYVAIPGKHHAKIGVGKVRDLFKAFKKAEFFWLFDSYAASITDSPGYKIAIYFDGRKKVVTDYAGRAVGMPKEVTNLEELLDTSAGTARWVSGNALTIPTLKAEGWNFKAKTNANAELLLAAARANPDLAIALVREGVSARGLYGCHAVAAMADPDRGMAAAEALFNAGAPAFASAVTRDDYSAKSRDCSVLSDAASWGNPALARLALAKIGGAAARKGLLKKAILKAADGRSKFSEDGRTKIGGIDYPAIIRLLVANGADVNTRDEEDKSLLMNANIDPKIVRALLDLGATDLNTPNEDDGTTPLMNSYDPEVSQTLLVGGANPYLTDKQGRTALDHAHEREGQGIHGLSKPITQWIAAHPPKSH